MNQKPFCGKIAAVCAASLMLLTSCSNNSSNSIGGDGDGDRVMPPLFSAEELQLLRVGINFAETLPEGAPGALQTALGSVADAIPAKGVGPIFNVQGTGIYFSVSGNGIPTSGNDVYQATLASRVSVKVTATNDGLSYTWDLDRPARGDPRRIGRGDVRASASDAQYPSNSSGMFSSIAFGNSARTRFGGASGPRDQYYVSIFTDHDGSDNDADYLAAGFWLHVVPARTFSGRNIPADVSFGAFADSDLPFDFPTTVAGSATYSGKATGVCVCPGESDPTVNLGVFDADAMLNANFGTSIFDGSITGFVVDGERLTGDRMRTVTLLGTVAGDFDAGFFTGDTSLNGETPHGKWGGEFYGVRDADNLLPGSVGGTFGASAGGETFVGAFGAHRQ